MMDKLELGASTLEVAAVLDVRTESEEIATPSADEACSIIELELEGAEVLEVTMLLVTTAALAISEDVELAMTELGEDPVEAAAVCATTEEEALVVATLPVADPLAMPAEAGDQNTAGV
jgi:hypothetical protein